MARRDIERSKLNISDKEMDSLRRRAAKADTTHWTDPKAVQRRLADRDQREKARQS